MKYKNLMSILAATAFLVSMGCASGPDKVRFDASTNPADAMALVNKNLHAGLAANYDVLDQSDFSKAQARFDEAKEQQRKGAAQEKVLATLGEAQAYLNKAKAVSADLQPKAQGILEARDLANAAGIRKLPVHAAAMTEADDNLRSEMGALAEGNLPKEKWSELQNAYMALELSAIQDTKLGSAKAKVEGARANGGGKNTPNALKQADFDLQNAANVISANRHNDSASQAAVAKANESAQFLVEVLAQTKQPGSRVSEAVATSIVSKDRKINSLNREAADSADVVNGQNQEIADKSQQLKIQGAALSLDQALETARKEFKPNEADVYRQGDKLLIRLKNVNFASGRSDLPAASLSSLSKVKGIAQNLNPQHILVEGHTDSLGTSASNMTLSQSRAEAVASYFGQNGVDQEKVEAVGYGFKKPLVANKTKEGRATNRRVDIIITPTPNTL